VETRQATSLHARRIILLRPAAGVVWLHLSWLARASLEAAPPAATGCVAFSQRVLGGALQMPLHIQLVYEDIAILLAQYELRIACQHIEGDRPASVFSTDSQASRRS
jgi:hypothetical protein